MAPSYDSKIQLYSKQESPIFLFLAHGVHYHISVFGQSQSFSDNSNLMTLVDIQRLH